MLVNDDPSFIDVIGDSLRAQGMAVLLVPGVPQAVTALGTGFHPDAILLDLLRRGEVRDLLRAVGRDPALRGVPVIATAREREQMVQIAPSVEAGPLATPNDAREFAQLLQQLCAHEKEHMEHHRAGGAHP